MRVDERDLGPHQADQLVRPDLFGRTLVMDDLDLWGNSRSRAKGPRPQAQVGFLAIHHIGRIETFKQLPGAPLDQQEAPGDDIDLALAVPRPATICLRIEDSAVAKDRV